MSYSEERKSSNPEEIELLVFTMMGVRMGVETREIAGMLKPEDARLQGLATVALHERLQFRGAAVRYDDPHVLVMRDEWARRGIVIDHPEEIALVKIDSIRPIPDIIALSGTAKALWGVVLRDAGIIFLLDCCKIAVAGGTCPCC